MRNDYDATNGGFGGAPKFPRPVALEYLMRYSERGKTKDALDMTLHTLGLGANTPINTGNESEGLLALKDGKFVVLRVPYPTGYYTKWMDGRIDDPKGGWKGRGIWSTVSTRTPFHMETGKGTTSKVIHFQMRPDPLAR